MDWPLSVPDWFMVIARLGHIYQTGRAPGSHSLNWSPGHSELISVPQNLSFTSS